MKTKTIKLCLVSLCLFAIISGQSVSQEHDRVAGPKFQVVSVRVLQEPEASERTKDVIGPNVAVRLRLSSSNSGFYYFSSGDNITPIGYTVKVTENGPVWLNKMPGHLDERSSPGFEKLNALAPAAWRLMIGHDRSAVEWEELDSTSFAGERHAFTAFIKTADKDKPIEIVSDSFVVPAVVQPRKN